MWLPVGEIQLPPMSTVLAPGQPRATRSRNRIAVSQKDHSDEDSEIESEVCLSYAPPVGESQLPDDVIVPVDLGDV